MAQPDACKSRKTREKLGKPAAKTDALQSERLAGWFRAVRADANAVVAAYLQTLLLTGARREELAGLRWQDVDLKWKALRIRDKVEGSCAKYQAIWSTVKTSEVELCGAVAFAAEFGA